MFQKFDLYQGQINPQAGYLCMATYWRPGSELPGEKASTSSYIVATPNQLCLCGSGKSFEHCCQRRDFWHPICPNPGIPDEAGYSLLAPQKATFHNIDGDALRITLNADGRFQVTEDTAARAFWIYFGYPQIQTPYGVLCFGDLELIEGRTLLITAMSTLRMHAMLDVLRELFGDTLGRPRQQYDPVYGIDKRSGKMVTASTQTAPARRRKR